jgi:hypothetical protein
MAFKFNSSMQIESINTYEIWICDCGKQVIETYEFEHDSVECGNHRQISVAPVNIDKNGFVSLKTGN